MTRKKKVQDIYTVDILNNNRKKYKRKDIETREGRCFVSINQLKEEMMIIMRRTKKLIEPLVLLY